MKKTTKILAVVLVLMLIVGCFAGCSNNTQSNKTSEKEELPVYRDTFVWVEKDSLLSVYVHRDTYVMYAYHADGGFELLVNPDGTPMVYEGELPE